MEIIAMHRGEGKTSAILRMSSEKQIPILCRSESQKKLLKVKAKRDLGIEDLPEPLTLIDRLGYSNYVEVLVDDLEYFMRDVMKVKVVAATIDKVEKMSFFDLCLRAGLTPDDVEITDLKRYVK